MPWAIELYNNDDDVLLERAVGLSYVLFWFIHRIHTTGGFSCLYFSKLKRGELKSIVTILIFVMLPFQLYYGKIDTCTSICGLCCIFNCMLLDMASCKVKYEEGYVQMLGHIVTKPEFLWTQADRDLITPTGKSNNRGGCKSNQAHVLIFCCRL